MLAIQTEAADRTAIGSELVGDYGGRGKALLLDELADQASSCLGVSSGLYQEIQDLTFCVDGAPALSR